MMPPFRNPEHQASIETNKKKLGIGTFLVIVLIPSVYVLFIVVTHL